MYVTLACHFHYYLTSKTSLYWTTDTLLYQSWYSRQVHLRVCLVTKHHCQTNRADINCTVLCVYNVTKEVLSRAGLLTAHYQNQHLEPFADFIFILLLLLTRFTLSTM